MTVTGERQWIVDICETAMLAVLIAVSGVFRIPGLVPGTEFQLSASLLSMTMGTATILNVAVAMTFRVVVGLVWLALGDSRVFYVISGPVGSAAARVLMYFLLGKGLEVMLIAAAPGMIYTAATAWLFGKIFMRCRLERR